MHCTIKSQNEPGVSNYTFWFFCIRLNNCFRNRWSKQVVRWCLCAGCNEILLPKQLLQSRTQLVDATASVISSNNKVQEKALEIEDGPQEQKLEILGGSQNISIPKKSSKSRRVFKIHAIWKFFKNLSFKWVKLAQIIFAMYILTVTFTEADELRIFGGARTGTIIDANSENNEMGVIVGVDYTRTIVVRNCCSSE